MVILELISLLSSLGSGVDLLKKHFTRSTPESLFKKSFVSAVKQIAPNLADITKPTEIKVDHNTLDQVIASLQDIDKAWLTGLDKNAKLSEITDLFSKCVILPRHQLTEKALRKRLQPILERTFTNFYDRLQRNQEVAYQMMLKSDKASLEGQEDLKNQSRAIQDAIQELGTRCTDLSGEGYRISVSVAVNAALEKEYQSRINEATDLLKKHQPETSLSLLKRLKKEKWATASEDLKFSILTNMAAALLAQNKQKEAARLLIQALQYKKEDENALSNCALGYLLLENMEEAVSHAEQALEIHPFNVNAHVVLIHKYSETESLEQVIAEVPGCLHEESQVAYAFSRVAKEHGNLESAREWSEVANEKEGGPYFKANLGTILIEQIFADDFRVHTKQLGDSQKQQLKRGVELLTQAWNAVENTGLRSVYTDCLMNKSIALTLLGKLEEATENIDKALQIEPLNPLLLKNKAIISLEQGRAELGIELLEKLKEIDSAHERCEVEIIRANMLLESEQYDEAIRSLKAVIKTCPSSELQDEAKHLLIRAYIAVGDFEGAQRVLTPMLESSPESILNLTNAALIAKNTQGPDEAISQLQKAYGYTQNRKKSLEFIELANQLFIHKQFTEAANLYERLADTTQNSDLTQLLIKSYYNSGEAKKALEVCQQLRKKYGPLKIVSEMEVAIYEETGDMSQVEVVCKEYLSKFPDDIDMKIRLGLASYRANDEEAVDQVLKSFPEVNNLSLEACIQLAQLYQVRREGEKALHVIYEARRTYSNNPEAHLRYIGLFYHIEKSIPAVLNPREVKVGTAVQLDGKDWYVIEERDDADITRNERDVKDPLAKQLLGKVKDDTVSFKKTPLKPKIQKITAIKSKYVYALQESFRKFEQYFPDNEGLLSIELENIPEESSDKKTKRDLQPILEMTDKQYEASRQIEALYKEQRPPIGAFMNWTGRNVLEVWSLLINRFDLGIRCCIGTPEERNHALARLSESQPKLVVDLLSLITLHALGVADTVVKGFGKLIVVQSTLDELLQIIREQEGVWSEREGMTIGKQGNRYVREMINPADVKRSVEQLKAILRWVKENCDILPGTAALEMNLLQKKQFDEVFHPIFVDALLTAGKSGYVVLSDDKMLRAYAQTHFNPDAGTNFQIEGVWTEVVLEHCLRHDLLDKATYDRAILQLICSHYYPIKIDADMLMEAAKQASWTLAEPYNSLVQSFARPETDIQEALEVTADFLFRIWQEPIPFGQLKFLTLGILAGLTSGRETRQILERLQYLIQTRLALFLPIEGRILSIIRKYEVMYPFESNFDFLSEGDIRIKGTRIGIEDILYESLYLSQTPEAIDERFWGVTLDQVYATLLYYLQHPVEVRNYLENNLQYSQKLQAENEKNLPPETIRLRQLKEERQGHSRETSR